jgi:hypothetical protein
MPSECECSKVVLGQMMDITIGSPKFIQMQDQFCPRCSCKYGKQKSPSLLITFDSKRWWNFSETRKTGIIRVVVIIVIVVILSLSIYGLFLACLDPWMKRKKNHYTQHSNEEVSFNKKLFFQVFFMSLFKIYPQKSLLFIFVILCFLDFLQRIGIFTSFI